MRPVLYHYPTATRAESCAGEQDNCYPWLLCIGKAWVTCHTVNRDMDAWMHMYSKFNVCPSLNVRFCRARP